MPVQDLEAFADLRRRYWFKAELYTVGEGYGSKVGCCDLEMGR